MIPILGRDLAADSSVYTCSHQWPQQCFCLAHTTHVLTPPPFLQLTGVVHELPGTSEGPRWLEVAEWQQAGASTKIAGAGLWMPFEQHGLLLHKQ